VIDRLQIQPYTPIKYGSLYNMDMYRSVVACTATTVVFAIIIVDTKTTVCTWTSTG